MMVDFGKTLKELRLNAGLTQQQLAAQLGVTKTVVSYYELHTRTPSPEILVKLAAIFHVSSDYLLGIEKDRTIDVSGLDEQEITILITLVELLRKKQKY
jgi:transcriptional regulator with XRE-family HTH domain